jgi:c-di-GMP-binding flagellar brake protein YcgR
MQQYSYMSGEKRNDERFKLRVPVELTPEADATPVRGETVDLSLGGFYIEMLFTLEIGTKVDIALRLGESTLLAVGEVVTCDRTVGNGIQFTRMLAEDREELDNFLRAVKEKQTNDVQNEQKSPAE